MNSLAPFSRFGHRAQVPHNNDKTQKLCVPPVGVNTAAVVEPTFDCCQKYNAALGQIPTDCRVHTGFITGKRLHPQQR